MGSGGLLLCQGCKYLHFLLTRLVLSADLLLALQQKT